MAKLIDWICLNCHFTGRLGDRGVRCCDHPKLEKIDSYYNRRIAEIRNKVAGDITLTIKSDELYDKFVEEEKKLQDRLKKIIKRRVT